MFMSNKYRWPRQAAMHDAQRVVRTYNICPSIRQVFAGDVTYVDVTLYLQLDEKNWSDVNIQQLCLKESHKY